MQVKIQAAVKTVDGKSFDLMGFPVAVSVSEHSIVLSDSDGEEMELEYISDNSYMDEEGTILTFPMNLFEEYAIDENTDVSATTDYIVEHTDDNDDDNDDDSDESDLDDTESDNSDDVTDSDLLESNSDSDAEEKTVMTLDEIISEVSDHLGAKAEVINGAVQEAVEAAREAREAARVLIEKSESATGESVDNAVIASAKEAAANAAAQAQEAAENARSVLRDIESRKNEIFDNVKSLIDSGYSRINNQSAEIAKIVDPQFSDDQMGIFKIIVESFSGAVTSQSVRQGEACRQVVSHIFNEVTNLRGERISVKGMNEGLALNPNLWTASHMIEVGRAVLLTLNSDYSNAKVTSIALAEAQEEISDLRNKVVELGDKLKDAQSKINASAAQPGDSHYEERLRNLSLEMNAVKLKNISLQRALSESPTVLKGKSPVYIYSEEKGFLFINNANRHWWSFDLNSDPEALVLFTDAAKAVRAIESLRLASMSKNIVAYPVAMMPVAKIKEPVIGTKPVVETVEPSYVDPIDVESDDENDDTAAENDYSEDADMPEVDSDSDSDIESDDDEDENYGDEDADADDETVAADDEDEEDTVITKPKTVKTAKTQSRPVAFTKKKPTAFKSATQQAIAKPSSKPLPGKMRKLTGMKIKAR